MENNNSNSYNFIVKDYSEMEFSERFKDEPLDLGFANLTIVDKEVKKEKPTIFSNILKIFKAV